MSLQPSAAPDASSKPTPLSNLSSSAVFLNIIVAFIVAAIAAWKLPDGYNLLAVMVSEIYIVGVLGKGKMNHTLGILINERNLISLSRLQIMIWTVIITSTYFTVFLENLSRST